MTARRWGIASRGHGHAVTEGAFLHSNSNFGLRLANDNRDLACTVFVTCFFAFPLIFVGSVWLLLVY